MSLDETTKKEKHKIERDVAMHKILMRLIRFANNHLGKMFLLVVSIIILIETIHYKALQSNNEKLNLYEFLWTEIKSISTYIAAMIGSIIADRKLIRNKNDQT